MEEEELGPIYVRTGYNGVCINCGADSFRERINATTRYECPHGDGWLFACLFCGHLFHGYSR